jgi:hypothetical protein
MPDPVDQVLQLVASGRLTADEAGPILDALDARQAPRRGDEALRDEALRGEAPGRYARVEVTESGRKAVDLRIPLALGRMAVTAIPGLSGEHAAHIHEAISRGIKGPILDVQDEDGDGVRIAIE